MSHRILTCKNHPQLRWSCKDIAWTERADGTGYYNHSRNIFYNGSPDGDGMFSDGSGLHCTVTEPECICSASELTLAPEDALVKRA